MATATELQAQIDREKQAHARRLAELEEEMLTAEYGELTELITTHADTTLSEDEIEALEFAQILHNLTCLKVDIKVAKEIQEQVDATSNTGRNRVILTRKLGWK